MIDKKQIMLGNLLYWQGDEIGKVEAILQYSAFIRDKEDTLNEVKYHRLEPISLTPEILERLGFVKVQGKEDIYRREQLQLYHGLHTTMCYTRYNAYEYCYLGTTIKSLHQLQNLYFALTGQELQITL